MATRNRRSGGGGRPEDDASATLTTRGFAGRMGPAVAAATMAGLLAMAATFPFDPPVPVSAAALAAGILLVLGLRGGDITWRLADDALHRRFRPLAASLLKLAGRERLFPFAAIRSYRRETDLSRFHGEVERLVLALRGPPFRIVIHDMAGRRSFTAFADAFEARAAAAGIPRGRGFYETRLARVVTLALAASAATLAVFAATGTMNGTSALRLIAVILPGVAYMAYRLRQARARTPGKRAAAHRQEEAAARWPTA